MGEGKREDQIAPLLQEQRELSLTMLTYGVYMNEAAVC